MLRKIKHGKNNKRKKHKQEYQDNEKIFVQLPTSDKFDSVIIIFMFNMFESSQPTLLGHETDWFQS